MLASKAVLLLKKTKSFPRNFLPNKQLFTFHEPKACCVSTPTRKGGRQNMARKMDCE